jgi:O-6-methylguanine DNA methyltransferase
MRHLTLATRTPGPLADVTIARRGLVVDAYPLGDAVLLCAEGPVDGLDDEALWGRSVLRASREKGAMTLLLDGPVDADVGRVVAARGARLRPPIRWEGGEARVELELAPGADARALAALFPAARVVSKREGRALGAPLLDGLTQRQAAAIATAFEMGYYESPKRATTGDVAKRLGVARSTFEGHLSRAEKALIGAMLPLARARRDPQRFGLDALREYGAFSEELGVFVRMQMVGDAVRRVELLPRGQPTPDRHPCLERVLDHLRTGHGDLSDVPVDLEVGGFDRRVLDALRRVPPGRTVTYGELARRLGAPGAARAVGNACAKNPALVVIPCHRVVPAGGGVGSYAGAGGARTKRALLLREGASP